MKLTTLFWTVLVVAAVTERSTGQNYLSYGNECVDGDVKNACDNHAGLSCIKGICNCTLPTMEYFQDKDVCLAHVGTECYLDGMANCIDNAGCIENVFDGTAQCGCDDGFRAIAAPSCDKVALTSPQLYSTKCCPSVK